MRCAWPWQAITARHVGKVEYGASGHLLSAAEHVTGAVQGVKSAAERVQNGVTAMEEQLKTGLVGAGVFAGYHASKIQASDATSFSGVFDPDAERALGLAQKHGGVAFDGLAALFTASDAVIIASPASTHFEIGKQALDAGCHVLMEKPLALTGKRAFQLADVSEAKDLVLQVGHQERLVCRALGLFEISEVPTSIEIVRAGPPPQQGRAMDTSVIWDLMIHDIDLVHALVSGDVASTECSGRAKLGAHLDFAVAQYTVGVTDIKLTASRITPERGRHMILRYGAGEIVLDFLSREIRNSTSFEVAGNLADIVPDPLGQADEIFFTACAGYGEPLVTGREAAQSVATAERLEQLGT